MACPKVRLESSQKELFLGKIECGNRRNDPGSLERSSVTPAWDMAETHTL
jgi:hypothetical protein